MNATVHHDDPLRTAEDDLKVYRERAAKVAAFINDPAYDLTARQALAERLGLPGPRTNEIGKVPALAVTVLGRPAPQGSKKYAGHRLNRKSGRVSALLVEQSKRVKPWREQVTAATREAMAAATLDGTWAAALDGPLEVQATFTALKPARAPKRRRTWPTTRHSGDLDKLLRSTFDGIADAEAIADDSRIVRVTAQKVFPNDDPDALSEPGAVIRVLLVTVPETNTDVDATDLDGLLEEGI